MPNFEELFLSSSSDESDLDGEGKKANSNWNKNQNDEYRKDVGTRTCASESLSPEKNVSPKKKGSRLRASSADPEVWKIETDDNARNKSCSTM